MKLRSKNKKNTVIVKSFVVIHTCSLTSMLDGNSSKWERVIEHNDWFTNCSTNLNGLTNLTEIFNLHLWCNDSSNEL